MISSFALPSLNTHKKEPEFFSSPLLTSEPQQPLLPKNLPSFSSSSSVDLTQRSIVAQALPCPPRQEKTSEIAQNRLAPTPHSQPLRKHQQEVYSNDQAQMNHYNRQLVQAAQDKNVKRAEAIWAEINAKQMKPTIYLYTNFLHVYVKTQKTKKALKIFEEIKKNGLEPALHTYHILLNLYVQTSKGAAALDVLKKIEQAGFTPNQVTYTTLVKFCLKHPEHLHALVMLEKVEHAGFLVADRVYPKLFKLYLNQLNLSRVIEFFLS